MREAIPFIDLAAQRQCLGDRIDQAITRVLQHGRFILGPEVDRLEDELCAFSGARHTVTCANGTDALVLAMRALGLRRGDAVLVPAFTFSASAESVVLVGATPVFVDVLPGTFNIDPDTLEGGVKAARAAGLRPAAVLAVDLFGLPADYESTEAFCTANRLSLIGDAAQSLGAARGNARVGTLATVTTTSFFPSKPLSCYGDGGAVFTDDPQIADLLRSLRVHGQGKNKYDNVRIGTNSRLDTIQAAILLEKLAIFADELQLRQQVASRYEEALRASDLISPGFADGLRHAWALYTVRVPPARRDAVQRALSAGGVPTGVYYPRPLSRQPAYREFPVSLAGVPVSEALCREVLSLPMHPYLTPELQEMIGSTILAVAE